MRPLDELLRDAGKAASEGRDHLLINRQELRQLKDYGLVIGTADPNVALLNMSLPEVGPWARIQLFVRDVLP